MSTCRSTRPFRPTARLAGSGLFGSLLSRNKPKQREELKTEVCTDRWLLCGLVQAYTKARATRMAVYYQERWRGSTVVCVSVGRLPAGSLVYGLRVCLCARP